MNSNQKGFTLIESLVVLSIFLIISSITAFTIKPQYNMEGDQTFISQLKADLYYAQQYAISNQVEVKVNFIPEQNRYIIFERNDLPNLVERNYSPNIRIISGSLLLYLTFTANGSTEKIGTLYIYTEDKSYRLTVLIGKGRFYVSEE